MKLRLKANIRTTVEDGDKKLWKLLERHGYELIGYWDDDLGIVRLNGKWGVINTEGKEVVPLKYDDVEYFHEGLAAVKLNGKWGFVDKEGKEVIPLKYDSVGSFHEGLAGVLLNGQGGLVDKTGKELLPCVYNQGELPVKTLEEAIKLSNRIKKKYEQDPEGLELTIPEVDWKSWYEQLEGQ